jgi:hypothetical protein
MKNYSIVLKTDRRWNVDRFSLQGEPEMLASIITVSVVGLVAAFGAVASVVVAARDGYRSVPTRRA